MYEFNPKAFLEMHANNWQMLQQKASDPFVYAAVRNACASADRYQYSKLELDFRFITKPLQRLLREPIPVKITLQHLEALTIQFQKYYNSPEVDWSREFDTGNDLLTRISWIEPSLLARELSISDWNLFQRLDVQDFQTNGDALRVLNAHWNRLCSLVECMATGLDMRSKFAKLAKVYTADASCHVQFSDFSFLGTLSSAELLFIDSGYSRD